MGSSRSTPDIPRWINIWPLSMVNIRYLERLAHFFDRAVGSGLFKTVWNWPA